MKDKTFQISCFVPERALHSSYTTIIDQNILGCISWRIFLNVFMDIRLLKSSFTNKQ